MGAVLQILLQQHVSQINEIREIAPTWLDFADEMHDVYSSAAACEMLAVTAPNIYMQGFYLGRALVLRERGQV
jgi:hypothetical protein